MSKKMNEEELQQRLVYALFGPAVALATKFGMPLSWMKKSLETAYFQHARKQNMSLRDICALMNISISKAALLSKQLKDGFIVEDEERSFELTQRIEYMLCSGPLTLPRLNQVLPNERFRDIESSLDSLIEEGKVEKIRRPGMYPRYALVVNDEAVDSWRGAIEKLRRLNQMLHPIMPSIYTRFVDEVQGPEQGAHHIVRLTPDRLEVLGQHIEDAIAQTASEFEARAGEEYVEVNIAAFWHKGARD